MVTDVWAMRAAGITGRDKLTARMYTLVAAAYLQAAEGTGYSAAAIQAVAWTVIRGGAE